ncbi:MULTISPECIES: STAS domain-containing protein [Modicisalibacter]|uniref:STAS domain-containing protein n=1 Tax=Modicisalibacter tunisiensis TaxID=390637 RepID=A0ABS7X479_9GAMM|nr:MULTISPECIES: STAS domain-containing protein [Modicisalibacter]KXS39597.1 MAG: anti-sigma-factor antagonist domain-containing protein [Halomonadaceae bacterium T82-2]MBZ9537759.1 STAS domain-containing protein [Modicisalibacter tunisiensis]MBZ9568822.1 STAS domain-containing protein [Modicisalibacter tunisiensis]
MTSNDGRLKAAFDAGVFVLKLCGDVRLTLCATLDNEAQRLANMPGLTAVIVDLREATNVDSTALGFLAKVALAVKGRLSHPPTIVVDHPDVRRMLDVMGFSRYFTLVNAPIAEPGGLNDLPAVEADESGLQQRILEAHRILMRMNEHNREEFKPLVELLETQQQNSPTG